MTGNGGGYNGTGAYNGNRRRLQRHDRRVQRHDRRLIIRAAITAGKTAPNVTPNTRERIRQSLQQSGFRDVSVTPEAFVIHAMAPDGSHIVMLLRPDELTGVIESGSSNGGGNGNYGNSGWNGGANTNNSGNNGGGTNR